MIILGLATAGAGSITPEYVVEPYTTTVLTSSVVGTERSVSVSTQYRTATSGGYPTCPYGGRYYSRICTSLCGCQTDVCVTFDRNCANDYKAVRAGGQVHATPYVVAVTFFRTQCTTLQKEALATSTVPRFELNAQESTIALVLLTGGLAVLALAVARPNLATTGYRGRFVQPGIASASRWIGGKCTKHNFTLTYDVSTRSYFCPKCGGK